MRRPPARSRSLALMALALGALAATPALGPRPGSQAPAREQPGRGAGEADRGPRQDDRPAPRGGPDRRGDPAGAEKLDLLVRLRGKDHWQTGDARRDVETYEQLAAPTRAVQDRFAEARSRVGPRAKELFGQGQYAQAPELISASPRDSTERSWARATPTPPPATTTWPRPSTPRGSTPRPRRCTAAPWRSA